MEFPGIGGGRTGQAVKDVRSALEQAEAGPKRRGRARQPGDPAGPEHPRPRHRRQGLLPLRQPGRRPRPRRAPRPRGGRRRDRAPAHPARRGIRLRHQRRRVHHAAARPAGQRARVLPHRDPDDRRDREGAWLRPASGGDPHGGAAHPRRRRRRGPAQEGRDGLARRHPVQPRRPAPARPGDDGDPEGGRLPAVATAGKNMFVRLGKIVPIVGGVIGAGLDGFMQHRVAIERQARVPHGPTRRWRPVPACPRSRPD